MEDLNQINEVLDLYVRPQTFPLAIKMLASADEVPAKAKMPSRDLGMQMPLCQGIALSRRYGWSVAIGKEDMSCPLGAVTLGFVPAKAKFLNGDFSAPGGIEGKEARAKFAQSLPRLEHGKYTHLVAAPLSRADFEPQIIMMYGNPAQVLRLVQSAVYASGVPVMSEIFGFAACAGYITKTILTDQCQFVLPCSGDRMFALTQDHEVAFAMPISKVEVMMEGLKATHKTGLRYPMPSFLAFRAELPPSYIEAMDYLKT